MRNKSLEHKIKISAKAETMVFICSSEKAVGINYKDKAVILGLNIHPLNDSNGNHQSSQSITLHKIFKGKICLLFIF